MNTTFCMFPWVHLSVQPDGEVLPCCWSSPMGLYKEDKSLDEVWNSEEIRNLRVNMLKGIESPNCQYCYTAEKLGQESYRQLTNKKYKHHLKTVKKTKEDGTVDKLNLVHWDFRFSNLCNFKCRMCNPVSSTRWYSDDEQVFGAVYNDGKPTKIDVLDELNPLFDIVEEIYFAGGEPLIMDEHYYILNKLIELKKTNVRLVYSTNLSVLRYKKHNVIEIWKNFEDISVGASLDGTGKRGELIRNGMRWRIFLSNLASIRKNVPQVKCSIGFTTQVLNCFTMMETQKMLVESKLLKQVDDFLFHFLEEPEILSIQILDKESKKILIDKINEHIENFLIPLGSVRSLSDYRGMIQYLNLEDKSHLIPLFKKHCSLLDTLRNENTKETFPELKNLWDYE